ncbi:glycerophosphoryl diester phosphodiesterase membrane domain-containing protein [Anaeromicrobium sediminis]|uniref:Glycerophosphoryl diester phosphodiesterase membrane domain-containing protein n=1 Tax=Anaeromicrobium sediminis TaxID=1478221 RepID=A0A267MJ97_9FIRM|nr:glycerophosphoryl diester phosphodiesterase membrane domain-containing protein [Anaeromicrobium sediminis]PAB59671.1 hypothetical protein CCE28_08885 [Anaeromicrobium sediminis]
MEETYKIMEKTEVIDKSFSIHKKNLITLAIFVVAYGLIYLVAAILGALIGGVSVIGLIGSGIENPSSAVEILGKSAGGILIILVLGSLFLGITLARNAGIINIASNAFLGKNVSVEEAFLVSFKSIPRLIGVTIAGIIWFIPFLVGIGVVGFIYGKSANSIYMSNLINTGPASMVGIVISTIIFVAIIMLIIYTYITLHRFAIHTAILEDLSFFKALKKSRQLVKGEFWKIFGILMAFYIIVGGIKFSIYALMGEISLIGGLITKFTSGSEEMLANSLMASSLSRIPVNLFTSVFVAPVADILVTILYYNQRFKKDGYDLKLTLENIKRNSIGEN